MLERARRRELFQRLLALVRETVAVEGALVAEEKHLVETEPGLGELQIEIVLIAALDYDLELLERILEVLGENKHVIEDDDGPVFELTEDGGHDFLEDEACRSDTFRHELWGKLSPWRHNGETLRCQRSKTHLVESIDEVKVQKYLEAGNLL